MKILEIKNGKKSRPKLESQKYMNICEKAINFFEYSSLKMQIIIKYNNHILHAKIIIKTSISWEQGLLSEVLTYAPLFT